MMSAQIVSEIIMKFHALLIIFFMLSVFNSFWFILQLLNFDLLSLNLSFSSSNQTRISENLIIKSLLNWKCWVHSLYSSIQQFLNMKIFYFQKTSDLSLFSRILIQTAHQNFELSSRNQNVSLSFLRIILLWFLLANMLISFKKCILIMNFSLLSVFWTDHVCIVLQKCSKS